MHQFFGCVDLIRFGRAEDNNSKEKQKTTCPNYALEIRDGISIDAVTLRDRLIRSNSVLVLGK